MKIFEKWINKCEDCPNFVFSPLQKDTNKGGCKELKKIVTSNSIDTDCNLKDVVVIDVES